MNRDCGHMQFCGTVDRTQPEKAGFSERLCGQVPQMILKALPVKSKVEGHQVSLFT